LYKIKKNTVPTLNFDVCHENLIVK